MTLIRVALAAGYPIDRALQWGRGFSAAEMAQAMLLFCAIKGLQWGRGFSAAEMARALVPVLQDDPLQWGRGFSAAEISPSPC